MRLTLRLMAVLGKKAFLSFAIVTLLVGALLSAVEITSRHALKLFVEDQLRRIPWDIALYQTGGVPVKDEIPSRMKALGGIQRVERLAFLRASFPGGGQVGAAVDGKPLGTPWICLMAASDPSLLPPKLQFALGALNHSASKAGHADAGILALVGPDRAISKAFLALQGARQFSITVDIANVEKRTAFTAPVQGVIREGRDDLNRWLMDQTGSISLIPAVATILLMPYHPATLAKFDSLAMGLVPTELIGPGEAQFGHVEEAEYIPEVIYLGRFDRARLISGWDVAKSVENVQALRKRLMASMQALNGTNFSGSIDSTTLVLLQRMNRIAHLIGIVTLLIALPLLWMAWVLAANLSGLLMLNERRKFGLLRLRGVPAALMGRALVGAVLSGGLVGGLLGLGLGSTLPLLIYEGGHLPLGVLFDRQQLLLLVIFLVVTLILALEMSRRFVLYAVTISPLEASGHVSASEAASAMVRFGPLQLAALVVGTYKLAAWMWNFSLAAWAASALHPSWVQSAIESADHILDFVALPLFLYGVATLLVSRRSWIQRLMEPIIKPVGGRLGNFALKSMAVKPHRAMAFLLIVALMAGVSVYPIVAARSFRDKAVRGARVQMGAEWQFTFNSPDLANVDRLAGEFGPQYKALQPGVQRILTALKRVPGVTSATAMVEAILPNFYLPGYGIRGVPLYLIAHPKDYLRDTYSEPALGLTEPFGKIVTGIGAGGVGLSPSVSAFWRIPAGKRIILGRDDQQRSVSAPVSGVLAFLPGMPPQAVSDRQGYVQARLDYLNFLFSHDAYLAGSANDAELAGLRVMIPRVIVLTRLQPGMPVAAARARLLRALPVTPLEVHDLPEQIHKAGSDMYIFLALENMRIYLAGGLVLALIGVLAIAMANYSEERHTLALLRIRGSSPAYIWRFLVAMMISPAFLGLILGSLAGLAAGYGLANYLWQLREIQTAVEFLHTHLIVSAFTVEIIILLAIFLVGVASLFSLWVFRRTARDVIQEGQ